MENTLAWHSWFLALLWVPFAVVAGVIDTWNTEGGRRFRVELLHPWRTLAEHHPRFIHAH